MEKTGKLHKFITNVIKGAAEVVEKNSITIKSHNWFNNSNLTMQKSLFLTYAWAHQLFYKDTIHETSSGISDDKVVTTSSETTCDYNAYCRDICYKVISHNGFDQIGGPGLEVEIDKSKFRKRKYMGIWWHMSSI